MWNNKTVAVIFPVYEEKKTIKNIILEFDATGFIDEIIVVGNITKTAFVSEIKQTRAQLIKEELPGYGNAVKTGIKSTKADLLIIAEPDGTYEGKDLVKFLSYSDDFDMVFGSRTHVPLIQKKSEMTFRKRLIEVMLGKLISLLCLCPPLTDVSCNYRLTNRKAWQKIIRDSKSGSSLFVIEWLLLAAKNRVKFIQIPVNFKAGYGLNTLTSTKSNTGPATLLFILRTWTINLFGKTSGTLKPRYS